MVPRTSPDDDELREVREIRGRDGEPANRLGRELGSWLALRFAKSAESYSGTVLPEATKELQRRWAAAGPDGTIVTNSDGVFHVQVRFATDVETVEQPLKMLYNTTFAMDVLDLRRNELVQECRRRGRSWADIAMALGVTRQSAWERYSAADD